jgi:hypothetical protein
VMQCPSLLRNLIPLAGMLLMCLTDAWRFLRLCLRPSPALAAGNLFLRKQLALYQERQIKPRRPTQATRMALAWLAGWFNWRQALVVVQPATLIRWHRQGFRQWWRWKSMHGRPPLPAELRALIRRMARENPPWGEERIANELRLCLPLLSGGDRDLSGPLRLCTRCGPSISAACRSGSACSLLRYCRRC